MPRNLAPIEHFGAERHLDLQADLHSFFDTLVSGKTVLDVGAGLGRSKERIHRNQVTTYEPSEACRPHVDLCAGEWPTGRWEVVTAFEVLEHVEDDEGFLRALDARATQVVFLTTPNWCHNQCRSRHHVREYLPAEFHRVIRRVWPEASSRWWQYRKNAQGGWCEPIAEQWWPQVEIGSYLNIAEWPLFSPDDARSLRVLVEGLKHVVLIAKNLSSEELATIDALLGGRP